MSSNHEYAPYSPLPSPPWDTVSSIQCSPVDPDRCLVSSWGVEFDSRLYSLRKRDGTPEGAERGELLTKFSGPRGPILDVCWRDDGQVGWDGGLEGTLRQLDVTTGTSSAVGTHSATQGISALLYNSERKVVLSGSWERSLKVWDARVGGGVVEQCETEERVYKMDSPSARFPKSQLVNQNANLIVVGMASRLIGIWDIRNITKPLSQRESSLKYMTRSLAAMVDGDGYVTASVEGRIAVDYFDPAAEVQEKKYAFKCHRNTFTVNGQGAVGRREVEESRRQGWKDGTEVDRVYPVNGIAFHPVYNTFASYGSDGTVSIWDHKVKKRLRMYSPKFNTGVTAGAFNCDGTLLVLATGQTCDDGSVPRGQAEERTGLWVREVGGEVRPKT